MEHQIRLNIMNSIGANDWVEYYSNTKRINCWWSKSRKEKYPAAARNQVKLFKVGWVMFPDKSFYNVFTGAKTSNITLLEQYVHPAVKKVNDVTLETSNHTSSSQLTIDTTNNNITSDKRSRDTVTPTGETPRQRLLQTEQRVRESSGTDERIDTDDVELSSTDPRPSLSFKSSLSLSSVPSSTATSRHHQGETKSPRRQASTSSFSQPQTSSQHGSFGNDEDEDELGDIRSSNSNSNRTQLDSEDEHENDSESFGAPSVPLVRKEKKEIAVTTLTNFAIALENIATPNFMHLSESSNDEYRTEFNTIFEQMKDYNATNSEASAFTPIRLIEVLEKLRHHSDPNVKDLADQLVEQWIRQYDNENFSRLVPRPKVAGSNSLSATILSNTVSFIDDLSEPYFNATFISLDVDIGALSAPPFFIKSSEILLFVTPRHNTIRSPFFIPATSRNCLIPVKMYHTRADNGCLG